MVIVVAENDVSEALAVLNSAGEQASLIGQIETANAADEIVDIQ